MRTEGFKMEAMEMYANLIIEPLEKEVKALRMKIDKKKFSFTKKQDKEHLEKMEKLLFSYQQKFATLIKQEITFEEEFKKKLTKINKS